MNLTFGAYNVISTTYMTFNALKVACQIHNNVLNSKHKFLVPLLNTCQVGADAHVGERVLEYERLQHEGDEYVEDAGDGDDVEGEEVQLGPLRSGDEHVPVGDDVPLVHHHELEQHHEARHEVVKVAAAIPRRVKIRVLEADVAARSGARSLDISDQVLSN